MADFIFCFLCGIVVVIGIVVWILCQIYDRY